MVAHSIAKSKEPHTVTEQLILPAAVVMVNPIMIDESAGFSALALMKSKYRSKLMWRRKFPVYLHDLRKCAATNGFIHPKNKPNWMSLF